MRLLFASGVWVPASGGSEISAHTLARELCDRGHEVSVLTGPCPDGQCGEELLDGVAVRRVPEPDLELAFRSELDRFRPQLVLTQLMWSERILRWAKAGGLPTVYFLRSEGPTLDLSTSSPLAPTAIVANSPTTQRYALRQWGRDALIVLPLVRLADYVVPDASRRPRYVTMFNPVKEKGGHLFRQLAIARPRRRFLAVEGWHHWRRPTGEWDLDRLASAARGYGGTTARPPEEVPLGDLPNVTRVPAAADVRPFYAATRVLVVPSVWAEPFGRVILEAMVNGIPVLYSGLGSTRLAASGAGIEISDPQRFEPWVDALTALDEPEAYARAAAASRQRARSYDLATEVDKVDRLISELSAARTP